MTNEEALQAIMALVRDELEEMPKRAEREVELDSS
jgi:hypothetical protein